MRTVVGATTMGELASAINMRTEEAPIIAELKAGSEDAYSWLISQYHQPIYSLVYRIIDDPADAPDTTQEVFLKVFRGMKSFNGESSLKTWIYRIAVHEASNRRRWWFRHKVRETSIESSTEHESEDSGSGFALKDRLVDCTASPFENVMREEIRAKVEAELKQLQEPYRTTIVLRDIEELSYEQIADVMNVSLGTVKSRIVRGREALKKRLERFAREMEPELGLESSVEANSRVRRGDAAFRNGNHEIEVTP